MLDTKYKNDILTVKLKGEIDHNSAAKLRTAIDSQINALRPKLLELDFSKVGFMDSSGIGLIMGRYRSMGLIGGKIKVVNVPENIGRIISLSGISALGVLK
ncbi:MAG: STAS domain-containing protein [Oscillospiraceae bacterium]|nr:STAS domain-containing protein [Oscillospiraceae bacterium]